MRISVSEWSALKLAVKLPRALVNPALLRERDYTLGLRGAIVVGCALAAVLAFLHVQARDAGAKRQTDLLAQLAAVKLIDARWDVVLARSDGAPRTVVQSDDLPRIQRALDGAAAEARTTPLKETVSELKKAFIEKADVVARFQKASADARQALAAAMRADAAVASLVRGAWRDFPQRERLVAAENLVARILAEAQQYYNTPNPAHRASLEGYSADLQRAQSLPRAVQAGLARLESDVHQLLLLKPLEHMLGERLGALNTAHRMDELTDIVQRDLADAAARRDRYHFYLLVYSGVLIALIAYFGAQALSRYRALEQLCAEQASEFAGTLHRLGDTDTREDTREARAAADNATSNVVSVDRRR